MSRLAPSRYGRRAHRQSERAHARRGPRRSTPGSLFAATGCGISGSVPTLARCVLSDRFSKLGGFPICALIRARNSAFFAANRSFIKRARSSPQSSSVPRRKPSTSTRISSAVLYL